LKDYNNFEEKGELKDRLKAFYAFYYKMEKEIRAEGKKTLMMAKGLPEFDTLEFNVEIYKMRKGCEFISKNKPQLVVIFNHSAIKSKE
jgi:hypothetical protein